jgi:hypothetical protein
MWFGFHLMCVGKSGSGRGCSVCSLTRASSADSGSLEAVDILAAVENALKMLRRFGVFLAGSSSLLCSESGSVWSLDLVFAISDQGFLPSVARQ